MNVIVTYVIIGILTANVFFIVLFFYQKTRPKKQIWTARCYQLGEGMRQEKRKDSTINLQDMRPYSMDVIEKVDAPNRKTIYRLQKENKSVGAVTADDVEIWGKKKVVDVLIKENSATILKKGYDTHGNKIFIPLPRSHVEQMTSDLTIKKERNRKEKGLLAAVMPYVAIVMALIGIMFISHTDANIHNDLIEHEAAMLKDLRKAQVDIAQINSNGMKQSAAILSKEINDFSVKIGDIEAKINKGKKTDKDHAPSID